MNLKENLENLILDIYELSNFKIDMIYKVENENDIYISIYYKGNKEKQLYFENYEQAIMYLRGMKTILQINAYESIK